MRCNCGVMVIFWVQGRTVDFLFFMQSFILDYNMLIYRILFETLLFFPFLSFIFHSCSYITCDHGIKLCVFRASVRAL